MNPSLIIQSPDDTPAQLILLFHGVGANESDLEPLGLALADEFPNALIVSLGGSDPADFGNGRQWFSIREVSEENRPARVAAALPAFIDAVRHWQRASGVGVAGTALVGFSQGAIMSLEAAHGPSPVAGRVVAIAGRFAKLPEQAAADLTLHFFHGKADPVIAYGHTVSAAEHLIAQGADVTADVLPFVGHEINEEIVALIIKRLKTYVPRRVWEAAMQAGADGDRA